ncbi:MAG: hypothetical protein K8W52_28525 [Deltaproteobacteria bacterium]|nr:hypothetical protein [Deltaproteobacteria bacterium]
MSWRLPTFGHSPAGPAGWSEPAMDRVELDPQDSFDPGTAASTPETRAAQVALFAHLADGEVGSLANDVGRGSGDDPDHLSAYRGAAPDAADRAAVAAMMANDGDDLAAYRGAAPAAADRAAVAAMMAEDEGPSDAEVARRADEMAAARPDLARFRGRPPGDQAAVAAMME